MLSLPERSMASWAWGHPFEPGGCSPLSSIGGTFLGSCGPGLKPPTMEHRGTDVQGEVLRAVSGRGHHGAWCCTTTWAVNGINQISVTERREDPN